MCQIFAKDLDLNLNQAVIDKISNFLQIAPNFTSSQKFVIFKVSLEKYSATASTL